MAADVIDRLRSELGPDRVVTDADVLAPYETDWTGRFTGRARAVVRPRSVDEVAAVIAACREDGIALVPQGGNTGLVGGGVPRGGEVVLATAALAGPLTVDPVAGQITVGAGRTLGEVQRAAAAHGWRYPIDLGARDTATIGGTVATNAGGNHVLAHGMTRRHLLGIEAVLGTGAVVRHLGGLVKDNTGYDLAGLLCGSEGTLGVVTELRLALVPPPEETAVALVGLDDLAAAVAVAAEARRHLPDLEAAEVVLADGVTLVRGHLSLAPVLDPEPPVTLLLEVAGPIGAGERLARHLAGVGGIRGSALATDAARRSTLWRVREEHNPAINREGPPHKYDVTLPLDVLDERRDRGPGDRGRPGQRGPPLGVRARGRWEPAPERDRARPRRRPGRRGRAQPGRRSRRQHQRRARHRCGQAPLAVPGPQRGRDRHVPGSQGRPRP